MSKWMLHLTPSHNFFLKRSDLCNKIVYISMELSILGNGVPLHSVIGTSIIFAFLATY